MEVHKPLVMGFKEIIYNYALEVEFAKNETDTAEKRRLLFNTKDRVYHIHMQLTLLFIIQSFLEVKATSLIVNGFIKKPITYFKSFKSSIRNNSPLWSTFL